MYDLVESKTVTAELFGMRSLGPFYTACLKAGRFDLILESRHARSKARMLPQQTDDTALKKQMAGLLIELRHTRKTMERLRRKLDSIKEHVDAKR